MTVECQVTAEFQVFEECAECQVTAVCQVTGECKLAAECQVIEECLKSVGWLRNVVVVVDRFYMALFSARERTHCACM